MEDESKRPHDGGRKRKVKHAKTPAQVFGAAHADRMIAAIDMGFSILIWNINTKPAGKIPLPGDAMADLDEIRQQLDLLNDEELLSILRDHDYEQWRPEVFDIVSSILRGRGVSLGTDADNEKGILDESAARDLITVASYFNYIDAETDRLALEGHGLRAWIFNGYVPQSVGPVGGVELKVMEEDLAAAMQILGEQNVPPEGLDNEFVAPPCPKCGHTETSEEAEVVDSINSSLHTTPKQILHYTCTFCGYKWSGS